MDKDKLDSLRGIVENSLQQQIANIESVKSAIEEDLKTCSPDERDQKQKVLNTAIKLLDEMKAASSNINALINGNDPQT